MGGLVLTVWGERVKYFGSSSRVHLKLFGRGGGKSGVPYAMSGTNSSEGGGQIFTTGNLGGKMIMGVKSYRDTKTYPFQIIDLPS